MKKVTPDGYSIKEITKLRGVSLSLETARAKYQDEIKTLKKAYKEYLEIERKKRSKPLTSIQLRTLERYKRENPDEEESFLERTVRGITSMPTENAFIKRNKKENYSLTLSV